MQTPQVQNVKAAVDAAYAQFKAAPLTQKAKYALMFAGVLSLAQNADCCAQMICDFIKWSLLGTATVYAGSKMWSKPTTDTALDTKSVTDYENEMSARQKQS